MQTRSQIILKELEEVRKQRSVLSHPLVILVTLVGLLAVLAGLLWVFVFDAEQATETPVYVRVVLCVAMALGFVTGGGVLTAMFLTRSAEKLLQKIHDAPEGPPAPRLASPPGSTAIHEERAPKRGR
jgi:hypothetical protein